MSYESANSRAFIPLWKKYRPVVLQLMKKAVESAEAQDYQLSKHEFDDLNPIKSTSYSFSLTISRGMRTDLSKKSLVADDLLAMLKGSERAWEMLETSEFHFELDKKFVLRVQAKPVAQDNDD